MRPPQSEQLSPEQLRIIELVARGWTDQRVASALGISESTVKRRLRAAGKVLGVGSRAGIAAKAAMLGLISTRDANK